MKSVGVTQCKFVVNACRRANHVGSRREMVRPERQSVQTTAVRNAIGFLQSRNRRGKYETLELAMTCFEFQDGCS